MSNKYMREVQRIYNITDGVDGLYHDPLEDDMIIIQHDGNTIKLHKNFLSVDQEKGQKTESEVEFTQCNDCGYRSTSSADCCISCGSLNTHKDAISYEEWVRDY